MSVIVMMCELSSPLFGYHEMWIAIRRLLSMCAVKFLVMYRIFDNALYLVISSGLGLVTSWSSPLLVVKYL